MDLSKLPKLSETDKHTPMPPPPEQHRAAQVAGPVRESAPADAWLSLVIGAIIQLLSTRFWSFAGSKLFGTPFTWNFTDIDGSPLPYTRSVYFFGDVALVLFGLVLIGEAAVAFASRNRLLLGATFTLTVIATLLNLVFLIQMMSKGYGLQLMSALAVAFGGYIAINQWHQLQSARPSA